MTKKDVLPGAIAKIVAFCLAHRLAILLVALSLAGGSLVYTVKNFAISTNIDNLIAAELPWRQREAALSAAFPQRDDLILAVVDGASAEAAETGAKALAARLAPQQSLFQSVTAPGIGPFFEQNGLLYLDKGEVERAIDALIAAQPFLATLAQDPSLRGLAGMLALIGQSAGQTPDSGAATSAPLRALGGAIENAIEGSPSAFSWRALIAGAPASPADNLRFLQIKPVLDYGDLEPGANASAAIREAARDIGVHVRLTGPVALQDEEFATIADGALLNNSIMALAVGLILWRALRWGRLIFAVTVNLLIGLFVTAAIGLFLVRALNPISIAFAILFVGIGVDFGIQYAVRCRAERHLKDAADWAVLHAGGHAGKPLALAAAATAAGFYAFLPTAYRGLAELGVIAGTGMIVAFVTSITVLPALLSLLRLPPEPAPIGYAFLAPLDEFLARRRFPIIFTTLGVALLCAPLAFKVRFDFNPLNLRSAKVESVSTLLDLMQDPRTTPNTIDILAPSLADAETLAKELSALPQVESATTVANLVPEDQGQKRAIIADARALLLPSLAPAAAAPSPSDEDDRRALAQAGAALAGAARNGDEQTTLVRRLGESLQRLAQADPQARQRARAILIAPLPALLQSVRAALAPQTVDLASLPAELRRDWLTSDGRARIEIAPRGDKNDNETLRAFTKAVQALAPDASGAPVSILESGDTIVRAFLQAGAMALASIGVLLYLALRRLSDVALTLAPLLLAGLITMEICGALDLPLNFANIIALPLLLGLGVAFKIYYVLAWRAGAANLLQTSLTRAIFFSALTTASAFGSLWMSNHPGTSSMGRLLALSLLTTLCAAVLFQPALMGPPRRIEGDADAAL